MHYVYVDPVNDNLVCGVCGEPFQSPRVLPCGHTFCLDCLERALAVKAECPLDRSPASIDECSPAGRIINNMLNELKVHCEHRDKGCKAVVERQTLEGHLANVCEYHPIPCGHDPCSATVVRTDKAKHEADCQYRPEACALCSAMVPKCQMEQHIQGACPSAIITCDQCEAQFVRSALDEHQTTCPFCPVPCSNSTYGCRHSMARKDLGEHVSSGCVFETFRPYFEQQRLKYEAMAEENIELKRRLALVETELQSLQNPDLPLPMGPNGEMLPFISPDEMDLIRRENDLLRQDLEILREDTRRMDMLQNVQRSADNMRLHEEVEALNAITRTLQAQITRLSSDLVSQQRSTSTTRKTGASANQQPQPTAQPASNPPTSIGSSGAGVSGGNGAASTSAIVHDLLSSFSAGGKKQGNKL